MRCGSQLIVAAPLPPIRCKRKCQLQLRLSLQLPVLLKVLTLGLEALIIERHVGLLVMYLDTATTCKTTRTQISFACLVQWSSHGPFSSLPVQEIVSSLLIIVSFLHIIYLPTYNVFLFAYISAYSVYFYVPLFQTSHLSVSALLDSRQV